MKCDEAQRLLSEALDGRLDESGRSRLAEHVAQCPSCAKEEQRLRRLNSILGAWEVEPAPSRLKSRILAAVSRARTEPRVFHGRVWQLAAAVTIAAAVALVLFLSADRETGEKPLPDTAAAGGVTILANPYDLPPEVATLAASLTPRAGQAAFAFGRQTASAVIGWLWRRAR